MRQILLLVTILFISAVFTTGVALADTEFLPIVPLPGVSESDGTYDDTLTFAEYVNRIFDISISIGGILAVMMLVFGGFEYMTSEATGGKKNGLDRIRGALTGLLLLITVVIILNVINPCLIQITALTNTPSDDVCSPRPDLQTADTTNSTSSGSQTQTTPGAPVGYTLPVGACLQSTRPTCVDGSSALLKCAIPGSTTALTERPESGCLGGAGQERYVCAGGDCVSTD